MTDRMLFALPGNETFADLLASKLDIEVGELDVRRFPDGEAYVRYGSTVRDRSVALVCSLDRPDDKFLPLLFSAAAARDHGATSVGLVCPYLAYMRQDKQFRRGEAVTSTYFARTISTVFDWLITVDPHLHRRNSLNEIYSVRTIMLHATPLVAAWVRKEIENPLLIGPDSESEQWVASVAEEAEAPYVILQKSRHGDRDVVVSVPAVDKWSDHTPVLVDDIISTARTMIETVRHLHGSGMRPPVCIGIHGIFAEKAFQDLMNAGAARIITTNSVRHATNEIDISDLVANSMPHLPLQSSQQT